MAFIIGIDFDGTLFSGSYPDKGEPRIDVIEKAKEFKRFGAEIFLWTCREDKSLEEALKRCAEYGLEFDAVNSSTFSQKIYLQKKFNESGEIFGLHKIFADLYVDDKSPGSIDFFLNIDAEKTCKNYENR